MGMKIVVSIDEGTVRIMCAEENRARAAMAALARIERDSAWEHVTVDYEVTADGGRGIKRIVAWNGDVPLEDADVTASYEVFELTLGSWLEIH